MHMQRVTRPPGARPDSSRVASPAKRERERRADHLLCQSNVRRSVHASESWYKYPAISACTQCDNRSQCRHRALALAAWISPPHGAGVLDLAPRPPLARLTHTVPHARLDALAPMSEHVHDARPARGGNDGEGDLGGRDRLGIGLGRGERREGVREGLGRVGWGVGRGGV